MSDGTKVNTEGSGGKRGSGWRNNFCNNNQSNNNAHSHTWILEELENATYIVSQFSLADQYEK